MAKLKTTVARWLASFVFALGSSNGSIASASTEAIPASYQINYNIQETGITEVTQKISLFNPSQDVYISDYTIFLAALDADEIEARDEGGLINPLVRKENGGTAVSLKFNQKVIGTNTPLKATLSFKSNSIARKSGLVWEVVLPGLESLNDVREYRVTLSLPQIFGPSIFSAPKPQGVEKKPGRLIYTFRKDDFAGSGAILSFGGYQVYRFNLKYHLKNPFLWTGRSQIALPPSIFGAQQVLIDKLTPGPIESQYDPDGNHLVTYELSGGKEITVEVSGRAKIYNLTSAFDGGTFAELPPELVRRYTSAQKYWETQEAALKELVFQTVGQITPQASVEETAGALFEKTVSTLSYDSRRVDEGLTRWGAAAALQKPNRAVCMEFADFYITLLRIAGIPAQLLEGFAEGGNEPGALRPAIGDVLHSWVRFYSPQRGWVSTDPTWAKTTGGLDYFSQFDTNHFAFAVKGTSSERPYPAGAYKISPDQVGDINITLGSAADDWGWNEALLAVAVRPVPRFFLSEKKILIKLVNEGRSTIFSPQLRLDPNIIDLPSQSALNNLPPFGVASFERLLKTKIEGDQALGQITWTDAEGKVKTKTVAYSGEAGPGSVSSANKNVSLTAFTLLTIIFLVLLPCSFWALRRLSRRGLG